MITFDQLIESLGRHPDDNAYYYLINKVGASVTAHTSQPFFRSYKEAKEYQKKYKHVSSIKSSKIVKGKSDQYGFIRVIEEADLHESATEEMSLEYAHGGIVVSGGKLSRPAFVQAKLSNGKYHITISDVPGAAQNTVDVLDMVVVKLAKSWNNVAYVSLSAQGKKAQNIGKILTKAHGGEYSELSASGGRVLNTWYPEGSKD